MVQRVLEVSMDAPVLGAEAVSKESRRIQLYISWKISQCLTIQGIMWRKQERTKGGGAGRIDVPCERDSPERNPFSGDPCTDSVPEMWPRSRTGTLGSSCCFPPAPGMRRCNPGSSSAYTLNMSRDPAAPRSRYRKPSTVPTPLLCATPPGWGTLQLAVLTVVLTLVLSRQLQPAGLGLEWGGRLLRELTGTVVQPSRTRAAAWLVVGWVEEALLGVGAPKA